MNLVFIDKHTKLPAILDLDNINYITYNSDNKRVIAHLDNSFMAFYHELSGLLLEFVNNRLDNYVYFIEQEGRHYLINIHKVKTINNINHCTIIFQNEFRLNINNSYAYHVIEKMVLNEAQNGEQIRNSSESNS